MARGDLRDAQWERLAPLLPPEHSGKPGHPFVSHRRVLNGILWVLRTGAPWEDMPERYGPCKTCYDRFRRWEEDGTWLGILQALQGQEDAHGNVLWEGAAMEATIVHAHQHAAGARRRQSGRSYAHPPRKKGERTPSRQILHPTLPPRSKRRRAGKPSDTVAGA